ncbi:hypothetical protein CYY_007290 [Polysphondylium violaceum]|uniref:WD40 repeat-containing protein n=1 Tax=Polysphondylium violaceum TaxID=133409 RepID=A0A8J4PXQ9_9MYCE|nr:hypothetical protein CYY_007290 [Polysphondylium violaceum]
MNNTQQQQQQQQSRLLPKIFPGRLHKDNRGAIDWHWQGLLAYASHSHVVIVDPHHMHVLQTLDEHRFNVAFVKWSNDVGVYSSTFILPSPSATGSTVITPISQGGSSISSTAPAATNANNNEINSLIRLASADVYGNILIWNALDASVIHYLQTTDQKSTIADIQWHPDDANLLLALHSNHLALWNVSSGQRLWKKDLHDFVNYSLQFDPFKHGRVYLSTLYGCVFTIDDLSAHAMPHVEFKYRVHTNKNNINTPVILNRDYAQIQQSWSSLQIINSISSSASSGTSSSHDRSHVGERSIPQGAGNNTSSSSTNASGHHHQHHHHHHYHSHYHASLDFVQMLLSPYSKNIIYYVFNREIFVYDTNTNQIFGSLQLDRSKSNFTHIILGRENSNLMFTLHDDGSITSWNRKSDGYNTHNYEQFSISDLSHYHKKSKKKTLKIYSMTNNPFFEQTLLTVSGDGIVWKWNFISEITSRASLNSFTPRLQPLSTVPLNGVVKLTVSALMETVSSPITSVSVYPFYNKSNISLLAVGTANGTIQIINITTLKVQKEIFVFNHPVLGLRWLSPGRVLCHSYEEQERGSYLNYITSVDFRSGRVREFRKVSGAETSFIRGIRLSYSRKFLIILMKDRPFELWETKRFTCLRSFKPFVHIVGLDWLPPKEDSEMSLSSESSKYDAKEQFTFLMQDGILKTCTIEQNSVTLNDVQADLGGTLQSCFTIKRDFLVSGDSSGNIHAWNATKKKLHTFSTHRGPIKKIRFSPHPESNEIMVLFSSGEFGIWDLNVNHRVSISSYLMEREIKALDFEWLNEVNPIIVASDHSLRILDSSLSVTNSKFSFSCPLMASLMNDSSGGGSLYTPLLLPAYPMAQLRNLLLNYKITNQIDSSSNNNALGNEPLNRSLDTTYIIKEFNEKNQKLLSFMDEKLIELIGGNNSGGGDDSSELGIPEISLVVAQYFGDYNEIEFWRLVINSLNKLKQSKSTNDKLDSLPYQPYNMDIVSYYDALPIYPQIPKIEMNPQQPSSTSSSLQPSPIQQPLNSNSSNININNNNNLNTNTNIVNNNNNNNNSLLNNPPNLIVSPSLPSTTTTTTTTATTTPSQPINTASTQSGGGITNNLLKKQSIVSFFGFGGGDKNKQNTTATPIATNSSTSSTPSTGTKDNLSTSPVSTSTPIFNSPPATPTKQPQQPPLQSPQNNGSSSTTTNSLSLSSILFPPSQPPPLPQVQIQAPPSNPLASSQVFSSVASQLNQSTLLTMDDGLNNPLGVSNSSAMSATKASANTVNSLIPSYYDILLDSNQLRGQELDRTDNQEKKRPDQELTKKLIEKNLLLGRNPRAVNLLLDTTPDHPDFFNRAMKACVISASISQEYYQQTTKLIAENLIATGKLDDGIQFLCLIGKAMEACKYLQACDRWYDAAVLSKINLSEQEQMVVYRFWAFDLVRKNSKLKALSILLSIGDFRNSIQILYENQQYALASLLIETCLENNIFQLDDESNNDIALENFDPSLQYGGSGIGLSGNNQFTQSPSFEDNSNNAFNDGNNSMSMSTGIRGSLSLSSCSSYSTHQFTFNQLVQIIFKEYGNLLHQLGNIQAAEYYWKRSGKKDLSI